LASRATGRAGTSARRGGRGRAPTGASRTPDAPSRGWAPCPAWRGRSPACWSGGPGRVGAGVELVVAGREMDARPCRKQVFERRVRLVLEEGFGLLKPELLDGLPYVHRPVDDVLPIEHR